MYGCYIKLDLPLKSPASKAAFIESWDETAQGINMFVWIAALKRGGVMFFPSRFYEKTKWFMGDL